LGLKPDGELGRLQFEPEVGQKARIKHKGEYNWRHPVAGIDVSKDKLIMYFQGKLYEFTNDRQGFEEIRKILPKGCKVGIESTGVYHVNLAKYLMGEYNVRIINPFILKKFKGFRGKKSDKNDAKKLAEIVVSMGSGFVTSDARELTSQWDFVTRSIARVKNRLRRDLVLLGYRDSLSKRNLEEVLRGGDSVVLAEVSFGGA